MRKIIIFVVALTIATIGTSCSIRGEDDKIKELEKQVEELQSQLEERGEKVNSNPNPKLSPKNVETSSLEPKHTYTELEKLLGELPVTIEKIVIAEQSSQYKSLYPDVIQVIVKNNGEQTIRNLSIAIVAYDKNGYPIKVKAQFSTADNYVFMGQMDDANIIAHATYGEDKGFCLDENHGISYLLGCVETVNYYDDTTWNNPYAEEWKTLLSGEPIPK